MLNDLYHAGLRIFSRSTFSLWQRLGFYIVPAHFYQPIPDTRELGDDLWEKMSDLPGLSMNEDQQQKILTDFQSAYKHEYDAFPVEKTGTPHDYYLNNDAFLSVDAEVLYCMIRHFKPRRIVEIGSGFSTYLSARAVLKNKEEDSDYDFELVAIEPYPNKTLRKGFPGLTELIPKTVQSLQPSYFQALGENDILFIDSSHVLKIGGDVQYEYLEILPRLKNGVIVHLHDIFLPAEYPKEWLFRKKWFWTEQYLLQAFMAFNDSFQVLWAGSFMNYRHSCMLSSAFASYRKGETLPGSFWIRRTR